MQAALDRVMQTYGMLVNITVEQELAIREKLSLFLAGKTGDENQLAVAGIKFLRGERPSIARRDRSRL